MLRVVSGGVCVVVYIPDGVDDVGVNYVILASQPLRCLNLNFRIAIRLFPLFHYP